MVAIRQINMMHIYIYMHLKIYITLHMQYLISLHLIECIHSITHTLTYIYEICFLYFSHLNNLWV